MTRIKKFNDKKKEKKEKKKEKNAHSSTLKWYIFSKIIIKKIILEVEKHKKQPKIFRNNNLHNFQRKLDIQALIF